MAESAPDHGILVGVDGSPESDAAVRWATREAVLHDAPVTLMHGIQPVVVTWPVAYLEAGYNEWQDENAQSVIEQARNTVRDAAPAGQAPPVQVEIKRDGIVSALTAASRHARMVVVGSRGMGKVSGAVLGSVSSGVLHHAQCPVAVVHDDESQAPDPASPVLLGIDGSPASEAATAFAFDEASRRKVELVALHAWSDVGVFPALGMDWHEYEDQGHEVLAERLAGHQERYPDVTVRRRIVCDRPAQWLVDESGQAQLVVVGSRGRGGFTGMLLGSVSSKVAREAKAPVVVVRG